MSRRRTAGRVRTRFLVLLGVLGVAVVVTANSFATSPPPAPSITSGPANPTSATSASFTYTDSVAITKFQCKLDGNSYSDCGTTRPSTKTYSSLSSGSHTFQVRAVSGSGTSSATPYTWLIDRTAPTAVSINRAGSSPTNAASVQWTVTFSEAVKGVDATDFALVNGGLGGSPSITGVTPSVSTSSTAFTVTASSGTGSGSLGLNLVDNDSIIDGVGNKLGGTGAGNGNKTGQVYTIDRTAPSAPLIVLAPLPQPPFGWPFTTAWFVFNSSSSDVASYECNLDSGTFVACASPTTYTGLANGLHSFQARAVDAAGNVSGPSAVWTFLVDTVSPNQPTLTQTPPTATASTSATFAWTSTDPAPGSGIALYLCKLDGGIFWPCSSPKTYTNLALGSHTFSVIAVDWAANISQAATHTWTVAEEEPAVPFTVAGDVSGLVPGVWFSIPITITNPNNVPIYVTSLTVTASGSPGGCDGATNIESPALNAPPLTELLVPASVTDWLVPAAWQPQIRLLNLLSNQDNCKSQTFSLDYSGSAHS